MYRPSQDLEKDACKHKKQSINHSNEFIYLFLSSFLAIQNLPASDGIINALASTIETKSSTPSSVGCLERKSIKILLEQV